MSTAASSRVAMIRNRRRPAPGRSLLPRSNDAWDRAREWNNPLRSFTLGRAISLAESYPRGEFADLMWTLGAPYNGIETADADLLAIIERRTSALSEMDWNAQPRTGGGRGKIDEALAEEQADAAHELMDGIGNLYEAIDHLALAFVRGFAHCEIIERPGGGVAELRPVDQWHVVRRGIRGPWRYNPEARQASWDSIPGENDMPDDRFVLREVRRPIGRIALLKFARQSLNDADWGAYVERYGIPSGVVTMPPDVGPEREAEFMAAAQAVAEAASGALPHGATWAANSPDKGSGTAPFEDRLKWLSEKLILAGTGGKLTMLAESGSGTLAGGAHQDAFDSLARGDAREIGEIITRQLVEPWLARQFPGRPISAYFELAFREEIESSAVIEDAAALAGAGYRMSEAELAEKTGYELAGQQEAETPAMAMQIYANRPGGAETDEEAAEGETALEAISGAKIEKGASAGRATEDGRLALWAQRMFRLADTLRARGRESEGDALEKKVLAALALGQVDPEAAASVTGKIANRGADDQPRVPAGNEGGGRWTAVGESQTRTNQETSTDNENEDTQGRGSGTGGSAEAKQITEKFASLPPADGNGDGIVDYRELVERNRREREAIAELRESVGVISPDEALRVAEGSEHRVEFDEAAGEVVKHGKGFGYALEIDYDQGEDGSWIPKIQIRDAMPSEYLDRMNLSSEVFGDDARVVGLSKEGGFVVRQTAIQAAEGPPATAGDVDEAMRGWGFAPVDSAKIKGRHISNLTWYRAEDRTLVTDAKPDNFIKSPDGLVPVDLIIGRFGKGFLEDSTILNRILNRAKMGAGGRGLESLLADLLKGGVEAWGDALAEAMAEGLEDEEEPES